jgi:hypothetical protein
MKPTRAQFKLSKNVALTNSPVAALLFRTCGWKVKLIKPKKKP